MSKLFKVTGSVRTQRKSNGLKCVFIFAPNQEAARINSGLFFMNNGKLNAEEIQGSFLEAFMNA